MERRLQCPQNVGCQNVYLIRFHLLLQERSLPPKLRRLIKDFLNVKSSRVLSEVLENDHGVTEIKSAAD